MTETILHDLKLVGTTSSNGGRFRNVRITGEAVLTGDTECRNMTCMGTTGIKGSLRADAIKLVGECKVEGNLKSTKIRAIGEIEVTGSLSGNRINLTGSIRVYGGCDADTLKVSGAVEVEGLLNADLVDVRLLGPCRAREIGGGTVTVKRSRVNVLKTVFRTREPVELTADLIEGDTLHLEHTRAAVVRGNHVTLGAGCEIGRVEYRDHLQVGKRAIVKERVKL